MEMDGQFVECPMCGKLHRIQRDLGAGGGNNGNGFADLLSTGQSTLESAQQAGSTVTRVLNEGLQLAGFSEQGIQKGTLASGLQSKMGPVSKGSLFSSAQSLGAQGGASKTGWIAAAAAAVVVAGAGAKLLYDKYQEWSVESARQEEEKRNELNLCEECWKVVKVSME